MLESGAAVHRERGLTQSDDAYLGSVSYQLVEASPSTVMGAFTPNNLPELLPKTKWATLVGASERTWQVELVQGNDWVSAGFTIYMEWESGHELRFWLDRSRPHDIDDAWGYFRAEPYDAHRTLVTAAVAVDIGSGLVTRLFGGAVQASILTTPGLIKREVERLEREGRQQVTALAQVSTTASGESAIDVGTISHSQME